MDNFTRTDVYRSQECWDNLHNKCNPTTCNGKCECLCHKLAQQKFGDEMVKK